MFRIGLHGRKTPPGSNLDLSFIKNGAVAQLAARLIWDQEATSSSLVGSTSCRVAPG